MTKGKKKTKKNKIVLIESTCPHCEFKWQRKVGLKRVQCPACKKVIEKNNCKTKEEAGFIPERKYKIFRDRLVELSGEKEKERNLMLFQLGIATGYRLGDLVTLTIGDILDALEEGEFYIQESKQYKLWEYREKQRRKKLLEGEKIPSEKLPKPRRQGITDNLRKLLIEYCKGKRRSEYAFISTTNPPNHIQASSFSKILKKVSEDKQLQLKNISGHSLRKTYAMRVYEDTGDIEYTRKRLGHKNVMTTQLYLGLDKMKNERVDNNVQRNL